jgi:sugar/nucleoside kinase (ribokinase family)
MFDVLGIGENSIDYVYRLPDYPLPNGTSSKTRIAEHRVLPGGQVATTLATCSALGLRASYAGVFGSDANGVRIREELSRRGVDIADAIVREAPNRYAVILVNEQNGERVVLWDRDARLDLALSELRHQIVQQVRVLHVDDVDMRASIAAAHIAREAGVTVTSDIDRVTARTDELVDAVTVAIFAAHVPQALTGTADVGLALRELRQRHRAWLCVTLGHDGAMLLEGDRLHHAPAVSIEPTDTTGAGDVFRGAFIYALLAGREPADILRFANAAAAVSCTREGAMDSIPTLADVERVLSGGADLRPAPAVRT